MLHHTRVLLALCFLFSACQRISNYPHSGDDREIVMVEEVVRYADVSENSSATLITLDQRNVNADDASDDNESVMDAADDLIFLAKKPQKQQQLAPSGQYLQRNTEQRTNPQIDLLTSDEEDSLTSDSASNEEHAGATATPAGLVRPIDMSDFLQLIPAAEVKSIAANYYSNDPEVQRAYAYLNSRDFAALKGHIIELPEVSKFLRYLNASGLDLVGFVSTLTNLTSRAAVMANEIEKLQRTSSPTATLSKTATVSPLETTTKQQLNGLHGLVDSILDVLPQDQILATFFDKLETDERFSKLVDSISSPAFAKILSNLESSVALRNLIFTLHNNGIYVTKIVDSLKAYFFLGTF